MHKKKKCQVMRRKELFYHVTWGSNVTCDVHWCVTVDYQQIANDNIANQIHGFTIDYGKFILIIVIEQLSFFDLHFTSQFVWKVAFWFLCFRLMLSRSCAMQLKVSLPNISSILQEMKVNPKSDVILFARKPSKF